MYYFYVLQSQRSLRLYKGITNNLNRRIEEHNRGKNQSTKSYKPWRLVYYEKCTDRLEARKKEIYFKSGTGRKKLNKL